MRATTAALLKYYIEELGLSGKALEIGGHKLDKCAINHFPSDSFVYHDLNIAASNIPNTIISDITNAKNIESDTFDIVFNSDVFEHIERPWLAAKEISRILKPGGIAFTITLWSWRNHPCPIDYWRFSPECLEFLFSDLQCIEKGYDLSWRRKDQRGFWKSGNDSVPVDNLGGWRENWAVYFIGCKEIEKSSLPEQFKKTDNSLASNLRMDTQPVFNSD